MDRIIDAQPEDVYDAVRGVVYSAYSVIMMELVLQDETAADEWLTLTARGMKMEKGALAMQLYLYNREKLGFLKGRADGPSDD